MMEQPILRSETSAAFKSPSPSSLQIVKIPAVDRGILLQRLLAGLLLLLGLPVIVLCALAVRIASGGPIFYIQERVGQFGRTFRMIKFRTMIIDAEARTGPVLSSPDDPRVTPIGRVLRATHFDELPQLLNVLAGQMSFIGPRPERPDFVRVFRREVPRYDDRHVVRPGITGLAQICLPYDADPADKLRYELFYMKQEAAGRRRLALYVLGKTALKAVFGVMPFVDKLVSRESAAQTPIFRLSQSFVKQRFGPSGSLTELQKARTVSH